MDNREIKILNIDDVLPNRFQPRIQFDEKAINELAESIKVHGVIQPIVVRKISDKYEIIAGERRYKASVLAGKKEIPAIITTLDDKESAEIALIENIQRQNLTPIEEAISYKKILDMGYLNQITLGEKLGKTQSTIANKLRLLNLNEDVQEALMQGKISERHARSLLRLSNDLQPVMLSRIINERLTVRKADEEIEKMLKENPTGEQLTKERNNDMNEDIFKDMNIPTEPIVEPQESKKENLETLDFGIPTNFNDINQINESKDNIETITPIEPIKEENSFNYEMPNETVAENSQSTNFDIFNKPNEETQQQSVNPGFMDVDKIVTNAEDIYKEPAPIPDMDKLLDTSNNPKVAEPESPMQQVPVQEEKQEGNPLPFGMNSGKFFNMFNREEDTNPNYVKDLESKEVNMDFGEPKIEPEFKFNNPLEPATPQEPSKENSFNYGIPSEPIIENSDPVPNVFTMEQPVKNNSDLDKTMDFTQTFTPFSLNDENSFTQETAKTPEPYQSTYSQPETVKFDDMGEIKVQLPEQKKLATADLKTVINTIRECAATIERFGFTIDTEEIDFEDSYQVTFKIDKN